MKTFRLVEERHASYLEATEEDLADVGLTRQDFTDFSKKDPNRPGVVYVKDDYGDLRKFAAAYRRKYGSPPNIETFVPDSDEILSYPMIWQ